MTKQSLAQPELYNLIAEAYKLFTFTIQCNSPAVIATFVNSKLKLHKGNTCCRIIVLDSVIVYFIHLIHCLLLTLLVLCIQTAETTLLHTVPQPTLNLDSTYITTRVEIGAKVPQKILH